MTSPALSVEQQIKQLGDARKLVLSDANYYPQIIQGILPIVAPPARVELRRWVAEFLAETFASPSIALSQKETLSLIVLETLSDPAGLNRTELSRVAHKRVMIKEYDAKLLGPGGFKVLVSDANVTLPSGEQVKSGLAFRNEFHLHPLAAADLFVPCGGRPESVNLTNVKRLFNEKTGAPHFKVIIEGANLFFTQDARMVLEKAGVVLYKDASANKGGVTSSSLEVLAALSLSHDQFEQHMTVRDENKIPAFYQQYVKEIQQRIENDADYEFECIWQEHVRSHTPRYLLTDMLSDKINTLNDLIQDSPLWTNGELRTTVLARAVPPVLLNLVGITDLLKRVPENYTKAIFGAYLASRYIYQFGLHANEMQFFTFMSNYLKPSVTDTKPKKA